MRFLLGTLALWSALCLLAPGVLAAELKCLSLKDKTYSLPAKAGVGVANVLVDPLRIITSYVPASSIEIKGRVFDMHQRREMLPDRFVIGDGSIYRVFLGIDMTEGSRLEACLQEIREALVQKYAPKDKDAWYETLRLHVADYLEPVPDDVSLPWDKKLPGPNEGLQQAYAEAAKLTAFDDPIATDTTHPIVPLENYLRERKGYCLQKTLLTSLLLRTLEFPHKVFAGGTTLVGSGHNWIELPDGRHLDTTWQLLEKPRYHADDKRWFDIGISTLFVNDRFPIFRVKSKSKPKAE